MTTPTTRSNDARRSPERPRPSVERAVRPGPTSRSAGGWLACAVLFGAGLTACGGGGGGGGSGGGFSEISAPETEPNDTPAGAVTLLVGQPGSGSLATPGDVDWWRIELARAEVLQLEVFATRLDHPTWDDKDVKAVARVELFHPDTTTVWRSHDYIPGAAAGTPSFGHAPQDLDMSFLRVPADGAYYLRVRPIASAPHGGEYAVRFRKANFGAPALEVEHIGTVGLNDTPATAQAITAGAIFGAHAPGDVDVYSFQVSAPMHVGFDFHGERGGMLGGAPDYVDAELRLIDTDGVAELARSDNVHFNDPRLEHAITTPGTYYLEVAQPRDQVSVEYMLVHTATPLGSATAEVEPNPTPAQAQSVAIGEWISGSTAPGDHDVFAFPAAAGDMLEVQVFDGSNSEFGSGVAVPGLLWTDGLTSLNAGGYWSGRKLTAIAPQSGLHYLTFTHDGAPANYRARVRVVRGASTEIEPNETPAQAMALGPGARVAGRLSDDRDLDFFRIDADAGKLVIVQCYAGWAINGGSGERGSYGSLMGPLLKLYDDPGAANLIGESSIDVVFCSTEGIAEHEPAATLAFIAPATAAYYLQVADALDRFGIDHPYVIERR